MKSSSISCVIVVMFFTAAHAQVNNQACLGEVTALYAHVNQLMTNIGNRHIRFVFRSEIIMKDSVNIPSKVTEAETILSLNRIQTISRDGEFYQDSLSTITVVPASKVIYRNDGLLRDRNGRIIKRSLLQFQDSLLSLTTVISCSSLPQGYRKVIVVGKELSGKKFPYSWMEFVIHPTRKEFKKITVFYHPYAKIHCVTYEFLELNLNYVDERVKMPVAMAVFNSEDQVKKKYAAFKVIDNRKTHRSQPNN